MSERSGLHYLVLAHDDPEHVARLVDQLTVTPAQIWLHVDGGRPLEGWGDVLNRPAVHDARPDLAAYFAWTQHPDEIYFQTLIAQLLKEGDMGAVRPSPMYVDWSPGDWALPRVLGASDVPALKALPDDILFARKFYSTTSSDALDAIDAELLS